MKDEPTQLELVPSLPETSPFAALVSRSARDPEALEALSLAYQSLPVAAREAFVKAVQEDANQERVDPGPILLSMLSVEDDATRAATIAKELEGLDASRLRPQLESQTCVCGTRRRGGALLTQPLYAGFSEVLDVTWEDFGITRVHYEPLASDGEIVDRVRKLKDGGLTLSGTIGREVLARVMWSYRRTHGAFPQGLSRFADVFSLAQETE